jgi:hypothetical protein
MSNGGSSVIGLANRVCLSLRFEVLPKGLDVPSPPKGNELLALLDQRKPL